MMQKKGTQWKQPDPRKQIQGKRNRAEGKEFEKRIDEAFAYCRARGSALIDKTPEPVKILERLNNGQFKCCYDKKAQPDYKGVLRGGRSVMFEAKFTSGEKITSDRVTDTQTEYLDQAAALGAHCYILAGFSSWNVYKIPWEIWRDMKAYFGRKYITEKDPELQQYKLKTGNFGYLMIIG